MGGDATRPRHGSYAEPDAAFGNMGPIFANALSELRNRPSARLAFICDKTYRPTEEPICKVEVEEFLTAYFSPLPQISALGSLTEMARESAESATVGSVAHTADLLQLAAKHKYDGNCLGEMYWSGDCLPGGPWGIIRDFLLDIGCPSRSHRLGLFDPDFTCAGAHLAQFPGGRYVFFLYLGGFGQPDVAGARARGRPDSPSLSRKYQKLTRGPLNIIDICSDSDMEERREDGADARDWFKSVKANSQESTATAMPPVFPHMVEVNANRAKSNHPEDSGGSGFIDRLARTTDAKKQRAPVKEAASGSYRGPCAEDKHVTKKGGTPPESEDFTVDPREDKGPPHVAPSGILFPPDADNAYSITQFTGHQSRQKVEYLASWCTPVLLEKPCRTEKVQGQVADLRSPSPTSFVRSVASKVDTVIANDGVLARGVGKSRFSEDEWSFVLRNTCMLGLYKEHNSNYIYPVSMKEKRRAIQILMEALRLTNDGNPITKESIKENNPDSWGEVSAILETLIESGFEKENPLIRRISDISSHPLHSLYGISQNYTYTGPYPIVGIFSFPNYGDVSENGSEILTTYPIPIQLPWEPQVKFWNHSKPNAHSDSLLLAEDLYGTSIAIHETDKMALCTTTSIGDLIPQPITRNITTSSILQPLVAFKTSSVFDSKEEELVQYMKEVPEAFPNTRKFSCSLIWMFFTCPRSLKSRIAYTQEKGWLVYNGYWKTQGDEMMDLIVILQTEFLKCLQDSRGLVVSRNCFKNLSNGEMHPRKRHLFELEVAVSSASKCIQLAADLRPYFLTEAEMDSDPMVLQLQNATVDLRSNTIRDSRPGDWTSKISQVRVPEYALPGAKDTTEPPEEKLERERATDFIWSVFRPDPSGKSHHLDAAGALGPQDRQNAYFLLCLLARLLEGRPLRRTVFLYSPRGRNSKKPIEDIIRYILGTYSTTCRHSIFVSDKKGEESNSSVSLSRASVRCIFGQEIDPETPWCNAVFKRRSDCGREGGTKKHSNNVVEYDPVYTVIFGCNYPPQFLTPPGNSEADRALIIYLPNKFCDHGQLSEHPISPRRFPKDPSVDEIGRNNCFNWAMLQVLLHVRRSNPDLDRIIADGTPTSRNLGSVLPRKTGLAGGVGIVEFPLFPT